MTFANPQINAPTSFLWNSLAGFATDMRAAVSSTTAVAARSIPYFRSEDRLFRTEENGLTRARLLAVNRPEAPQSSFETIPFRGQDVSLHYFEAGRPRSDEGPLLLIHGFASNAYQWNRIFDELSDRHHVIAIDLPGHGYSDCLKDDDYDMVRILPDLLNAFLDRKGFRDVTLVGSSLGGGISQVLASGNDRIRQLILFGSSGCTDQKEKVAPFVRAANLPSHLTLGPTPPYFFEKLGTFLTLYLYVHPTFSTINAHDVEEFTRPYRGNWAKIRARADYARQIRDLCVAKENQAEIIALQKKIRQPVLYVYSEADRAVPKSVPGALLKFIPNSRLIRIEADEVPTAGHTLMSDTPALALQIVEDVMGGSVDLSPSTAKTTHYLKFNPSSGSYEY
ncbi:MAG TPA: alpha/beta hydrolase [bacterium]|nr:alpha/beta hydrolase [bacterium]